MSKFYEHITESVWTDMQKRSSGDDIRKEEITEEFLQSVNGCFVGFSMRVVYHLTEKEYEPNLDDFCKYLEVDEKDEDPDTIKKIITCVKSHPDKCEKMLDKCMTFEKKLLEEKVICYIHRFVDDIVYCEKYHNTLSDIKRYASEQFRNDNSCENFFPTKNMISKKKSELFDNYIEDNWPTGYLKKKIDELIKKENDEMSKYGFKKEPGKTIADTVNDWWDSLDDNTRNDLAWDEFGGDAEEEWMSEHHRDVDYDGEDFDGDEWWDDSYYIRRVRIYSQEHSKKNESVWTDMQKRSSGDEIRKEDCNLFLLNQYAKAFKKAVDVCSDPRNPVVIHYDDTRDDFVKYLDRRRGEHLDKIGSKLISDKTYFNMIKYVKNYWGECKGIQEFIDKHLGGLNECEGVPGGATPANVGGMGAAYFPGPNGEPGSGDLPSPTGVVYHQVAPFGVFIKELKKKKKKKKFRKEDEPCSHSPNAKVYDYVDDYREYVDRTYTMMNRKK